MEGVKQNFILHKDVIGTDGRTNFFKKVLSCTTYYFCPAPATAYQLNHNLSPQKSAICQENMREKKVLHRES